MCDESGIAFVRSHVTRTEIEGKEIVEVGSLDVNGSVRPELERLEPLSYLGVDIASGPGVDELCDVTDLVKRYGESRFDVVIATELMEHVREWRGAITNMKRILRPGGTLVLTTRSHGFKLHGFPWDYWRYEPDDLRSIFSDFTNVEIERDPEAPGVFLKARKPSTEFREADLSGIALHSVARGGRTTDIGRRDEIMLRLRFARLRIRNAARSRLGSARRRLWDRRSSR